MARNQRTAIRVSDLIGIKMKGPISFLYCRKCGGEYSANAGDYFMAPDTAMKCCRTNMVLAVKREGACGNQGSWLIIYTEVDVDGREAK